LFDAKLTSFGSQLESRAEMDHTKQQKGIERARKQARDRERGHAA